MSQVIPNHVLRVGQTVCMAPKEDGGGFRQVAHPRGISMTTKYSYYTSERCVGQVTSQVSGHRMADTALYGGPMNPNSAGSFYKAAEKGPHIPTNGSEVEVNEEDPMSPSLDISIDNLNQLILQLDPTFQPLPVNTDLIKKKREPSPCRPVTAKTPSPPAIKCVEMNPTRVVAHESIQRSSSPTPQFEGILISRGTDSNCTPNGSLIFCEPQSHASKQQNQYQNQSTGIIHQAAETIAVPNRRSNQPNSILSSSLGSDSSLYTRPSFYSSEASVLSTSPGSDTSYILGSTHSLPYDDTDGYQFSSRMLESPFGSGGSFSNLNSPAIMSPTTPIHRFDHHGSFHHSKISPHASTKGHANSCPPSVNNSSMDIPILLVNGCLENGDLSSKSSRNFLNGLKRKESSSFNKTYSESSIPTCSDSTVKEGQSGMKFVMDTSKLWFKPSITRDQAIEYLMDKEPGTFIIRDSTSFRGSFGLAMKVPGTLSKTDNTTKELVRHFLIESSPKGVHLKGAAEEPYFGSLSAMVYQHTITPISLPCKLRIADKAQNDGGSSPDSLPDATSELKTSAACNVLYLNSVSTETLTGSSAIQKAVTVTFEKADLQVPTIVNFKATEQGVTLTDIQRKVFFRRHYPVSTLSFCSVDPDLRKWQRQCKSSRIFGFIAKNPTDPSNNVCHVFAEYDAIQPASPLITFLTKLIQQQERV
ncbi:PREDICTED: tensin-4 [Nanorana parkeri]|uniref:tensin-4 n=1 Tax=Nanorana parkeri TaxID=125878 RepID=UPI00085479D8|nr:PREDICTED: tensin-4 [Nanorana parkeri]